MIQRVQMEEDKWPTTTQMEKTISNILRRSVYTFLQNYQYLTTIAAILALPYSSSVLVSQLFVPSSHLLQTIHNHLSAVFQALGSPFSSQFFIFLSSKISQTISSSIFSLPFTFSFFLITKGSVFQLLNQQKKPDFSSIFSLCYYKPLFITHVCNFLCLVSANSTALSLLFFAFNLFEFGFSSSPKWITFMSISGSFLYSFVVANAFIVCNLALVSSAMEGHSGFLAILRACALLRGRTSTGLTLALAVNMGLAAIEALFHYRVVRAYQGSGGGLNSFSSIAFEGTLIAYLYSIFVVIDTVVSFMFFKSCKTGCLMDQQGTYSYMIESKAEEEEC